MFVSSDATGEVYVVIKEHSATASNPTSKSAGCKLEVGLARNLAFLLCTVFFYNSILLDLVVNF
jgi:hypothetical protein